MKTNENGITLLSLVITVIVLGILASVLVNLSLQDSGTLDVMNNAKDKFSDQKNYTENRIQDMNNGWANLLD